MRMEVKKMSDILEQPLEESKEITAFDTEDELLDAIRKQAEEAKNSLESDVEQEVATETQEETSETTETEETTNNEEEKTDESFDLAGWLKKNPFKVKDRDLEIDVDDPEEAKKLMHMGLNYHRKTQELAPIRKVADYATQHNISIEDMQMLADLKSGSKEALAELAKRNKVDIYDIDQEASYQPSERVAYSEMSEADLVAQEIAQDEVLYGKVKQALTYVPRDFAENVVSDARLLSAFRDDVANGVADKVMPQAIKSHSIYGGNFLEHYVDIANAMFAQPEAQANVEPIVDTKPSNPSPQSKAKASVGSGSSGANSQELDLWENVGEGELLERIKRQAALMKG